MIHQLLLAASIVTFACQKTTAENEADVDFGGMSEESEEIRFNLIDGEDADIQRFPFYAMLVKRESALKTFRKGAKLKLFCGSALIHPSFIITAFHCFKKKPFPKAWIAVFHVVDRCHPVGMRAVELANIFFHRGSTTSIKAKVNDIAVAQLKRPVSDIQTVNLPSLPPVVGRVGMLIGFGRFKLKKKKTDAEVPCALMKTAQHIEHPLRCRHVHEKVINAFCTSSYWRPDSMACRGDSGGPWLVSGPQGYEVQGLSSFGAVSCNPSEESDHYTNVYVFKNWILRIIQMQTQNSTELSAWTGTTLE